MKRKKNTLLFILSSVILAVLIGVLYSLPGTSNEAEQKMNDPEIEETTSPSFELSSSQMEEKTGVQPVTSDTSKMEQATLDFLSVWYTKKDRDEIEKLIGKQMTDPLYEQYFGSETLPTPVNEGKEEIEIVKYEKKVNTIDVYVKAVDSTYQALYEAKTSIQIGENKVNQRVLGKIIVVNEKGNWLIDEFEELDVEAE